MTWRSRRDKVRLPPPDFFDLAGSDPKLLNTGRIADPQPAHTPLFRLLAKVFIAIEARLRARGASAVRKFIWWVWGLVALVGAFLLVGPVINEPMSFDEVIASADISAVEWIATDVTLDYAVSRDDNGRFVADIDEHYLANFTNGPEPSIERVLVTEFEGADVELEMQGATIDGVPAEVRVDRKATSTVLQVSRADGQALEGKAEIELSYRMHNLISVRADDATDVVVDRWIWPFFAPSWPQAMKGIEVTITLSNEINDALVRQPRAYVGWLLVSGAEWLSPESESSAGVTYSFSNDDSLPPHADIQITADFEAGTFELPATTQLFWWQTWGPILPLAFLAVLTLFALAARRVVWADSAGAPWYLPRYEPPDDLEPAMAAKLLKRRRHDELVRALGEHAQLRAAKREAGQAGSSKRNAWLRRLKKREKRAPLDARAARMGAAAFSRWLRRVAEAGQRAGRLGSLYSVAVSTASWSGRGAAVSRGLRWAPDSYLRDSFLLAPIAITLVQWGLLRQLSHQVVLAVVWWPGLFVLVSTGLAIVTVAAVARPRPLTREGALAVQQLKGIDVWARGTRLLERGPIEDPLMPYAVLFESPRVAGRAVVTHAQRESGDQDIARGWRHRKFISMPAIVAFVAALAVLTTTIVTVAVTHAPYDIDTRHLTRFDDLAGTFNSQVTGFELEAHVSRGDDGQAQIAVVERLDVMLSAMGARAPQLAREWPASRVGQSLGMQIDSVTIDGRAAPYRQIDHDKTNSTVMHTQFQEVHNGDFEFEIRYTLQSAAVDRSDLGVNYQEVRWAGLLWFWDDEYYPNPAQSFSSRANVRPVHMQVTIDADLVGELREGGWIDTDHDHDRLRFESGNSFAPWVMTSIAYPRDAGLEGAYDMRIGETHTASDGSFVATFDPELIELRERLYGEGVPEEFAAHPQWSDMVGKSQMGMSNDFGAVLRFDPGTFGDVTVGAGSEYKTVYWLPYTLMLALAVLIILLALGLLVWVRHSTRAALARGMTGTVSASLMLSTFVTVPALVLAQCMLFIWTVMSMAGDDSKGWIAIWLGLAMFVAVTTLVVIVARRTDWSFGRAEPIARKVDASLHDPVVRRARR